MKFNEKLQKLRKEKCLSQESLADILNVSRQAVSKWETGTAYPETEKIIALSEMFGVTIDSLIKDGEVSTDTENHVSELYWSNRGKSYEYKSKRTLWGLPLIHINIGRGMKRAKGILAVGNAATGIVSLGIASTGLFSIGIASVGLISVAPFSVGLLLSIGALSVGAISLGAVAVGIFTLGAVSVGMFSLGAFSVASHISIGEYAKGHIAIGKIVSGVKSIEVADTRRIFTDVKKEQVISLIHSEFPNMWSGVTNFIVGLFN